jgi:threonine/homoserine/homoserine lactone efflux protein
MTAALPTFALASTLLILAPGPDSLLVLRNTLRHGRRAGWITASGTISGLLAWAVAAAFGLSALLRVSDLGYNAVRLAGACYLLWLGVSSLWPFRGRHAARATAAEPAARVPAAEPAGPAGPHPGRAGWRRAYLNGLLSNLLNPKIGVFFIAFLPGFIPAGAPAPLFPLALGLWFIAETGAWLATLAWMAARGAGWLRRSTVQRWLERITGVALIGFGLRLATQAR